MYEELVKRLRADADYMDNNGIMLYAAAPFYRECADAIEELDMITDNLNYLYKTEVPKWIPVTERLPERRKAYYLCYLDDDSIAVCYWSNVSIRGSVWEWHNPNWKEVTHWMPLPEPPKEEA